MATQLQLRQGTDVEHNGFTGAVGEITYDSVNKTVVVHDNTTVGGIKLLTENDEVGGGGAVYTAGTGISIANNAIAVTNPYNATNVNITGGSMAGTDITIDSTGLVFNNGSKTSTGAGTTSLNAISPVVKKVVDYEEGYFYPALVYNGLTFTYNMDNTWGRYTRIGNLVTVTTHLTVASVSGSPTTSFLTVRAATGLTLVSGTTYSANAIEDLPYPMVASTTPIDVMINTNANSGYGTASIIGNGATGSYISWANISAGGISIMASSATTAIPGSYVPVGDQLIVVQCTYRV